MQCSKIVQIIAQPHKVWFGTTEKSAILSCYVASTVSLSVLYPFRLFAIWMSFFDMNNLFFRYRIAKEVSVLEDNIEEHKQAIAELDQQKKYLFGNDRNLQRFAREKYLMKKTTKTCL